METALNPTWDYANVYRLIHDLNDELLLLKIRTDSISSVDKDISKYLVEDLQQALKCAKELNKLAVYDRSIQWA